MHKETQAMMDFLGRTFQHPQRRLRKPFFTAILLVGTLGLGLATGCGSERKKLRPPSPESRTQEVLSGVARQNQMEPRVLLTAAHSQSAFGQPSDFGLTQGTGRASYFAMPVGTTDPIANGDVVANARLLASKMVEIAKASPPRDSFDWLVIAANVIVGQTSDDPNARDLALRATLLDLIATYNRGFSATSGTETLTIPALPDNQHILANKLDERQLQYISGFRLRRDFGSDFYLAGADLGEPALKDTAKVPKLLVIWCPGSNLTCLEHFRANKTTPVHFLATRALDGQMETTQFYPVAQDVTWHGQILANTTVLAVSGLAGRSKENFRPDWLGFSEYVSLRTIIRNIFEQTLRKFFGAADADQKLADPNTFRQHVLTFHGATKTPLAITFPEGAMDFGLPVFWDNTLFFETLTSEQQPRIKEQLVVASPLTAQDFFTADVPFRMTLSDDVRLIEIFQDVAVSDANPSPWDLVIKREVDPSLRRIESFSHPFTRAGALPSPHRAVKIVARGPKGEILTSSVVRFQVRNIK
jgi:hypothetical protein